jgi:hypothetical protein
LELPEVTVLLLAHSGLLQALALLLTPVLDQVAAVKVVSAVAALVSLLSVMLIQYRLLHQLPVVQR